MARYEHIRIFQCAYMLALDVHRISGNFSKEHKYTLGEKIKNASCELLDVIMRVNSLTNGDKLGQFSEIDFKKENLRIYIRIAFDLKIISPGQLKVLNEKIEEIGRQLGGWQKSTAKLAGLAG